MMKKTLAILLCLGLIASQFFVMAVPSSAAEQKGTTVEVTLADGTVSYLGAQPVFGADPNAPEKQIITGYNAGNVISSLNAASGTLSFDAASGTLTLNNVSGVQKISCVTGSLILNVVGTNRLESASGNNVMVNFADDDAEAVGNLTIQGNGTLETKTNAYSIVSQKGSILIHDSVTVKVETTGTSGNTDGIHVANYKNQGGSITFAGNCKVSVTTCAGFPIRIASRGQITVKENANVTATNTKVNSWGGAMRTPRLEMLGGVLNLNVTGNETTQSFVALDCQGGAAGFDCWAKFNGGVVNVNVNNQYTGGTGRPYGLFFKGASTVDFAGSEVNIKISNKTGADDPPKYNGHGAVSWQLANSYNTAVTVSGGSIHFDCGENVYGAFTAAINPSTFRMTGGKITGTSGILFCPGAQNVSWAVTGGDIDFKATVGMIGTNANTDVSGCTVELAEGAFDSASKVLKTVVKPVVILPGVRIIPVSGADSVLNANNDKADGVTGLAWDHATRTLTLNNASGIKQILVEDAGDVTVEVKGKTEIKTDLPKVISHGGESGNLIFKGDGELTVEGKGNVVYCEAGGISFLDSVKVTVKDVGSEALTPAISAGASAKENGVITFAGNSVVVAESDSGRAIHTAAYSQGYGTVVVKDHAQVTVNVTTVTNWEGGVFASHYDISGGKMVVRAAFAKDCTNVSLVGIQAHADHTKREDRTSTFRMTGGTLDIETTVNASANVRPHGIFLNYASKAEFLGGVVKIVLNTPNSTTVGNSGMIEVQENNANDQMTTPTVITFDRCILEAKGLSKGLFNASNNGRFDLTISSGSITGSTQNLVSSDSNAAKGKSSLTVTGGNFDWESTGGNLRGTVELKKASITLKEGEFTTDSKVLKAGNPNR